MDINEAKKSVIKAGIKLVEAGLIARTWGNVSCRIDEQSFVITPSGRSYLSLTADDIVRVNIGDLSYSGAVKPSSEKGIHAEVYKLYPEINFVIHTHQENASVIAASGLDSIKVGDDHPALGSEVICAEYALPGTKSLRKKVRKALESSKGRAVIMKYHGALCFGKDDKETFTVASELEKACREYIVDYYLKLSKDKIYNPTKMYAFALGKYKKAGFEIGEEGVIAYRHSKRTEEGFALYDREKVDNFRYYEISTALPEETRIYNTIYKSNKQINHIIFQATPEVLALAFSGLRLRPLLDDFAQLIGPVVKNVERDPEAIAESLRKSSAVLVKNVGALCCGETKEDAMAVSMIMQKACKALIGAALIGKVKPINPLESLLMRYVYLKKYAARAR